MDEKKPAAPQEIADEQLEDVNGGFDLNVEYTRLENGIIYDYIGGRNKADFASAFLCPNCRGTLRFTGSILFQCYHCDNCDESWHFADDLLVNPDSHVWKKYIPSCLVKPNIIA